MFTSKLFFCLAARGSLALTMMLPLVAGAQNAFSPGGPEYSILGGSVGDQTSPQVVVGPGGGWLVWQDNAADNSGLGIKIHKLNGYFNRTGSPIRVNYTTTGDQEKPQVAALTNGGAVIVWQGGTQGFQDIYTRFIRSNSTFVAADVRVNTYTTGFQIDPVVATLKDGSVVVVWSSAGQDGSLQGIYAQRFTSAGVKSGSEFRINQFTDNNQRTPAVAALADGRFVVVWVSELQRSANSVDLYGRIYSSAGVALGDEFLISGQDFQPCANPSLASSSSGGFAVAWSQKDALPNNAVTVGSSGPLSLLSWDAYVRCFDVSGNALGEPARMNSVAYGDQFSPKLAGFGRNYLATWLSMGQDGSMEGVYGQFLDSAASFVGVEFRVNTSAGSRQINPTIATDGLNRFLVAWSAYGTSRGFDLFGRVYDLIRINIIPLTQGVRISWNTQPALKYQIQVSNDYSNWSDYGAPRTATTYTDQVDIASSSSVAAYRVVRVQ